MKHHIVIVLYFFCPSVRLFLKLWGKGIVIFSPATFDYKRAYSMQFTWPVGLSVMLQKTYILFASLLMNVVILVFNAEMSIFGNNIHMKRIKYLGL